MNLAELIDQAAARIGDQNALARALDTTASKVSDYKHDRRTCPLHVQAKIAELAGIDAKEWIWGQVCRQMGRATAAALLVLAGLAANFVAPGAAGALVGKR